MGEVFATGVTVSSSSIASKRPLGRRAGRRSGIGLLGCAALAAGMAASGPVWAQVAGQTAPGQDPRKAHSGARVTTETNLGTDDERRKDDSERMHESYDPKGIELGSFLLLPKLELDTLFTAAAICIRAWPRSSGRSALILTTKSSSSTSGSRSGSGK